MHKAPDIASEPRRLDELAPRWARIAGLIGVFALIMSVLTGLISGWEQFFRSYLVNYCYYLSLALGALFFVALQHLTRAGWSVVVRRLAEFVAATIPLFALLFVPLLVPVLTGAGKLYPWVDPAEHDAVLAWKRPFLNPAFFVLRAVVYFGVWWWLARYFLSRSLEQDRTGEIGLTTRMERVSAPGMILFAFTVTFFAFDVLMSVEPHWFSTIFGVYYFAGSAVGFFALLVVITFVLQRAGRLTGVITIEHYHDLGKLVFAFVVFWAYIAYSQYMLIWYANIPEETAWFAARQEGQWARVSLVLLFGHFVVPFLMLISRIPKRRKGLLLIGSVWVLLIHWMDVYWLVVPRLHAEPAAHGPLHLLDATCFVGVGGLFVAALVRRMGRHSLIPERDPRLGESLAFENY